MTVVLCMSVVLWQAMVSSGAMPVCRCNHAADRCCRAVKPAAEAPACCPACCAVRPVEPQPSCCRSESAGVTQCTCSTSADETQIADRVRVRVERIDLAFVAAADVPARPALDCRRPYVEAPALWPPGVRLQSLLCTWLI